MVALTITWPSVFEPPGGQGLASLRPTMPLTALRMVQVEMAVCLPSRGGQACTKSLYCPAASVNRNMFLRITILKSSSKGSRTDNRKKNEELEFSW